MGSSLKPRMKFRKYGKTRQLKLESDGDLEHLLELSESHWMANSAPIDVFSADPIFLRFLDSDRNGRVRCDEVRAAVSWLLSLLANRERVGSEVVALRLQDINLEQDEGRTIHAAAVRVLTNLGLGDQKEVTLSQVRDTQRIMDAAETNGDGIIPPGATQDAEIAQFIESIIAGVGGETDASGKTGVTAAKLDQFLKETEAYLAWCAEGETPDGKPRPDLTPLGADTAAAYAVFSAISDKVDEYFTLCATVAYNADSAAALKPVVNPSDVAEKTLADKLRAAPISEPKPDRVLNLSAGLNPMYEGSLHAVKEQVAGPVLGEEVETLTEAQWHTIRNAFAARAAWETAKPQTKVTTLGNETLRKYLEPRFREAVRALVSADKSVTDEIAAIGQVEKLILYQRWLIEFVNNFVNLSKLYDPEARALFEAGTLIMDARQFTLCVKVQDRAEHAKMAANSRLFVLYLELRQEAAQQPREIAVGVTSGTKGNLYVGKHGVFVDRNNRMWDAIVTQIIENPISFREALFSPFRRIGALVQSQVERIAGTGQKMVEDKVSKGTAEVGTSLQTVAQTPAAAPTAPAAPKTGMGTLLVGGSVAFSALGASLAYIVKTVQEMHYLTIIAGVGFLLLALAVPITLNAWLKLRRRDIGTLLEASGWAINAQMRLTRIMRSIFTRRPRLPKGALFDEFDMLRKYSSIAATPCKWVGSRVAEVGRDMWEKM